MIKRIIDGVTYNTQTSTLLATSDYETQWNHGDRPCEGRLYQTRGGAFFLVETINIGYDREIDDIEYKHRCSALSAADAQKWILTGDVDIRHNPFDEPPEAVAEQEPSATIYIRVPKSLKDRLDQAAKNNGISGNSWAMRCVERCLNVDDNVRKALSRAWSAAHHAHPTRLTSEQLTRMCAFIELSIEAAWAGLLDGNSLTDRLKDDAVEREIGEMFPRRG